MQIAEREQFQEDLNHLTIQSNELIPLALCKPGQRAVIKRIESCAPELKSKLCSMGLCPGHEVSFLYRAPLGDPITVQVLNSQLALRISEATPIVVALKS